MDVKRDAASLEYEQEDEQEYEHWEMSSPGPLNRTNGMPVALSTQPAVLLALYAQPRCSAEMAPPSDMLEHRASSKWHQQQQQQRGQHLQRQQQRKHKHLIGEVTLSRIVLGYESRALSEVT